MYSFINENIGVSEHDRFEAVSANLLRLTHKFPLRGRRTRAWESDWLLDLTYPIYMEQELSLDESFIAAQRDAQTVNSAGEQTAKVISGVKVFKPVNHVDHRGRVFEIYPGENDFWTEPIVYCYAFTVRVNTGKGWGLHQKKIDRYTLITGETLTVLYDPRLDSPTHGLIQKVFMSGQGNRQLYIPRGVWHLTLNIGLEEAFLINHPTEVYNHENPDRLLLDWNAKEIPADLEQFFPIQSARS